MDFLNRRKLDFVNAAKLILLVDVRGEEATFAGDREVPRSGSSLGTPILVGWSLAKLLPRE
jgi:hypothetical protein